MTRLLGINIPDQKSIGISLTYIYGIGPTQAKRILSLAKIDPQKKTKDLATAELNDIKKTIENKKIIIEGDLRRSLRADIKRLIEIDCYRGTRHVKKLPARGQRTKTNARTIRGRAKRTVGSGRKKAASPT